MMSGTSPSRFDHFEACPRCKERGKDFHGDNLAVYTNASAYCFSCQYYIPTPTGKRWEEDKPDFKKRGVLPLDYESDAPSAFWKWLLQYGLSYQYWRPFIGFSKIHQRIVFKVGNPVRFSLGRSLEIGKRKWYSWGDCHASVNPVGNGSHIVLVEDLISAHKVGQITESIPLFGTSFPHIIINYLQQKQKAIILWQDKDQADKVAVRAANLHVLTGCPVDVIITDSDPKGISYDEIRNRIYNSIDA